MADPTSDQTRPGPEAPLGTASPAVTGPGWRRWLPVIVGVAAFALGIGGGLLIAALSDDDPPAPVASGEPVDAAPEPEEADPVTTTIPNACLDAVEQAQEALVVLDAVVTSVRELEAEELDAALGRLEQLRPEARETAQACREALGI